MICLDFLFGFLRHVFWTTSRPDTSAHMRTSDSSIIRFACVQSKAFEVSDGSRRLGVNTVTMNCTAVQLTYQFTMPKLEIWYTESGMPWVILGAQPIRTLDASNSVCHHFYSFGPKMDIGFGRSVIAS
ncbi:hypothetical protein B0T13DRAFT_328943 [Neurospora crassa]|nr:hypothetical protein B0T13DRAFT_328943 [Neurospora crassa]